MQYRFAVRLTGVFLAAFLGGCASGGDRAEPALGGIVLENIAVLPPEPMPAEALTPTQPATVEAESEAEPEPAALGSFQLTYYWLAQPRGANPATEDLYHRKGCTSVAKVSPQFAKRLRTEGGGRLEDGRVINTSGACDCPSSPCFYEPAKHKRWGVGVGKRPLSPFRSVAVDTSMVSIGSLLYIPALDGLTMPGAKPWGGFVHDGCVIAHDTGGGVRGKQLDFFMAQRRHYASFDRRHRLKQVQVFDGAGHCEKKDGTVVASANRNSI